MTTIDILSLIPPRVRRITGEQMAAILADLERAGVSLLNDCAGDCSPRAWAESCRGLNCISIMRDGEPAGRCHGSIRFDAPGNLAPYFRAEVMFAPPGALDDGTGTRDASYLRRHARRLLIVDPPLEPEPEPALPPPMGECDHGHTWPLDEHDRPHHCPVCGEPWV